MKKQMMKKYMNQSKSQQLAETALSVVMAKWGTEAIAERDALRKRLDELKKMYPHHFLTEADIGNRETGAFQIVADWSKPESDRDSRVVYMGRTEDGNYLWKWTWPGCAAEFQDLYDTSSDGVFAIKEDAMMSWAAFRTPCSECCGRTGVDCLLCEEWSEDGSSESGE